MTMMGTQALARMMLVADSMEASIEMVGLGW
jgi:hypothetical protein